MKFFFPDALDLVDPSFDFVTETRSEDRIRQRDDHYAHEVFPTPPYDGLLVSKAVVEGQGRDGSRYTLAQRHRLLRTGVRTFFRLGDLPLESMGDCGAFSYVNDKEPPVRVDEVIDFYESIAVDYGVSVDHIILGYQADADHHLPGLDPVPEDWLDRQRITLELASEFFTRHKKRGCRFEPIGVAQGWSPRSYAASVEKLQKIGYRLIGLGGMVQADTLDILACLKAIDDVRHPETRLHLFGITRCNEANKFKSHGVASIDSTSPLKQAFKDDRDNYYTPTRTYSALRVPQVQGNPKLNRQVLAGKIDPVEAGRLERACLEALIAFDEETVPLEDALDALIDYERLHDGRRDRTKIYREVLEDRPWKECPCAVCEALGIHVILFRGAERNRRRGFHNLFVTYRQLQSKLAETANR